MKYSKKSLYLFTSLVLVLTISTILILKDLQVVKVDESIVNEEEILLGVEDDIEGNPEVGGEDGLLDEKVIEISMLESNSVNTYIDAKIDEELNPNNLAPITEERYIVNRGDTLYLIARRANISVDELKTINNIQQVDTIFEGQELQTKKTTKVNNTNVSSNVNNSSSNTSSREDDIYWLSRIIHAEAQGEPYVGKVAVGNVVLNRVAHKDFPNTIYGVIYDKQYGYVQFSPVLDGNINNTPNEESRRAAVDALNGSRPVGEALYFLNPSKSTNFWIIHNRRYFMTIGDHDFYF